MKKFSIIILTFLLLCFCSLSTFAETPSEVVSEVLNDTEVVEPSLQDTAQAPESEVSTETNDITENPPTAVPAVEQIINFLFDGKVTVSQLIEYITIIIAAALSFIYNSYKRKVLRNEKAISKTDIEIEDLKTKNQDMSNQLGLLGNMIVCAYLSNNLVDPELKKKLAAYAEELMKNTSINQDKLTEKLILAAQNPNVQDKVTDLKDAISKEAEKAQDTIQNMQEEIQVLTESLVAEDTKIPDASEVIDNLKIGE